MAVFGVAVFGMTEIVLFPSRHNHAGHAPIITIIVLFVVFGGGSLVFREYFSRRERQLELAKSGGATESAAATQAVPPEPSPVPAPRTESAEQAEQADQAEPRNADPTAEIHHL